MVVGKSAGLYSLEIAPNDSPDKLCERLEQTMITLLEKGNVVVISDFSLGTPFNLVCGLMEKYPFFHLTGVNLPMLFNLIRNMDAPLTTEEICRESVEFAKSQMMYVNDFIKGIKS